MVGQFCSGGASSAVPVDATQGGLKGRRNRLPACTAADLGVLLRTWADIRYLACMSISEMLGDVFFLCHDGFSLVRLQRARLELRIRGVAGGPSKQRLK